MNTKELTKNLNDLELKFDALKETMVIFQNNINNNITWFYAVVGIIIALIGAVAVALYFLVKSSVKAGVEKGIKDVTSTVQKELGIMNSEIEVLKNQIMWASGDCSINNNKAYISGLRDFSKEQLIAINVFKIDGSNMEVKYKIDRDGLIELDFKVENKINLEKYAKWNVIWVKENKNLV